MFHALDWSDRATSKEANLISISAHSMVIFETSKIALEQRLL